MPVYVYRCERCGAQIERRQSFSDAPLVECESCHGRLRKLILPAPVIFKGSGFYSTDHRSSSSGNGRNGESHKDEAAKPAAEKPAESSKDSGASTETGAKPSTKETAESH